MIKEIDIGELNKRIELNLSRLENDNYYRIEGLWAPAEYDWPGDKEGRALLSFMSHYKISGKQTECMPLMLEQMPSRTNKYLYFGPVAGDVIFEQQLSGHSWRLRGLCEHYEQFSDDFSLNALKSIAKHLYLPTMGKYSSYPVEREQIDVGGVSGSEIGTIDGWKLSSDVGCAFMSIDGLSHVYKITADEEVKSLLDEMIAAYLAIDKVRLRVQTHCTLTAARGMMRMYNITKDNYYLDGAKSIYELYVYGKGMTYTYQNLNWWGRPDTWTEPCAIVDSLMLAIELYKATGEEKYRKTGARIYRNGFSTAQRQNGGAGTDTLVCEGSPWNYLAPLMYEAFFCCTMRLSEGLWYIYENKVLLYTETEGKVVKDENGVYSDGDVVYAQVDQELEPYAEDFTETDGLRLVPIVKYYRVPKEITEKAKQRIIFK